MKTAIDEPLGDRIYGDSCALVERAGIDDALMPRPPLFSRAERVGGAGQTLGDVVGAQYRSGRCRVETGPAHHQAEAPGDRKDRGRAIGSSRDRKVVAPGLGVTREKRGKMRLDADWPHAGSAAAMRDAEGLVQIEVAHVGAHVSWPRQPDERIHVGASEIHLAPTRVRTAAAF